MTTLAKFDPTDYLGIEEVIAEYLTAALEDPNPEVSWHQADVAKARGMTLIAKDTGLGRESLHKALAQGPSPVTTPYLSCYMGSGLSCMPD
jgi:probable addiction module antidote protein